LIAILDYGSGNIRSAQRACESSGVATLVTSDYRVALDAKGLLIPGVGAFGACMSGLREIRGDQIIRERVKNSLPILGICVGMQILFEGSEELYRGSQVEGVGVLSGTVKKLSSKITPHIGWNTVSSGDDSILFHNLENERFYFVHSYAAQEPVSEAISSITDYEGEFISAIEKDSISAVQFHPEKSSSAGLALIRNWINSL
jgi:glutamine amidotransferase